jgi:hypothetical protein
MGVEGVAEDGRGHWDWGEGHVRSSEAEENGSATHGRLRDEESSLVRRHWVVVGCHSYAAQDAASFRSVGFCEEGYQRRGGMIWAEVVVFDRDEDVLGLAVDYLRWLTTRQPVFAEIELVECRQASSMMRVSSSHLVRFYVSIVSSALFRFSLFPAQVGTRTLEVHRD